MASNWWRRVDIFSGTIVRAEQCFYRLGVAVAKNPWRTILYCWIFVVLCVCGFLRFYREKNPLNLWVPPNSNFFRDTEWLMKNFKTAVQPQIVIITAPNVLEREVLRNAAMISQQVRDTRTSNNIAWKDVCFSIPIIDTYSRRQTSFANSSELDPSIELEPNLYCIILESMQKGCLEMNLLDLWNYDEKLLRNATEEQILDIVNTATISPVLGHPTNYPNLLGNIKRNSTGHIVSAGSLLMYWMITVDFTEVDMDKVGNQAGTQDWATEKPLEWEASFLKTMHKVSKNTKGYQVYFEASRSYGDVTGEAMFQDMDKLAIGVVLMVIYVQIIISNFNWIEIRLTLGSMGLLCVGMAFISACGISSLLGIPFGPVHTSLPFLLMGLGVDDMFVMMASWTQQSMNVEKVSIPERVGLMLQHAGMSITVTSLTDVMAFIIGASTILPSLQSFCLYAAIGVFLTFVFVITFFTACFVLDLRRVEQNRNGILPCIQNRDYKVPACSRKNYSSRVFLAIYSKLILTVPGKIIVLLIVVISSAFGLESALKIEQKFDPQWFIPDHSYLHSYIEQRTMYYPLMGYEAKILMGRLNYSYEFENIDNLALQLTERDDIIVNVDSWTGPFKNYARKLNPKFNESAISDEEWKSYISKFLFSPSGAKYQGNFRFVDELVCGQPAPDVMISSIDFRYNRFTGPDKPLPAMHGVEDMVTNAKFSTGDRFATVWAKVFGHWATDEVIHTEVMRNLMLTLICVMFCTVLLITNLQMCVWIFICVLLTMINVCGYMQRWGLTIDVCACIALELAIGLCIDYATHIGHTFLTMKEGTRRERALNTISHIGAAVLYGGGSTCLALSMLSQSDAYVFQSFFKIFTLVIIFGLFHGVVLLPVILSTIGPGPYTHTHKHSPVTTDAPEIEDNLDDKELSVL